MIGIYKITNPNGLVYIGQSTDINRRKSSYKNDGKSCNYQKALQNSLIKYGWSCHLFEVIEECQIEQLNKKERYWQQFYDCANNGLNCRYQKTDGKTGIMSEETKNKMKGKRPHFKMSKEHIEKLRAINIGNSYLKGKKFTQEHKRSMSLAKMGGTPHNVRKVQNLLTKEIYPSIHHAATSIGITYSKVYNCLTNRSINNLNITFYE